jgi:DNA-binding XRE family transcriptional regulator
MIKAKKNEIQNIMIRRGFTGVGLAKASDISQSYIVQIINGKRTLLATTAKKICGTLQCEFDDIFFIVREVSA